MWGPARFAPNAPTPRARTRQSHDPRSPPADQTGRLFPLEAVPPLAAELDFAFHVGGAGGRGEADILGDFFCLD